MLLVEAGSQARQSVVAGVLVVESKRTRILLPVAQAGALNRATSGLAVALTTGWVPATRGRNWNSRFFFATCCVVLLRTATCTRYSPSLTVPAQLKPLSWL